MPCLDFKTYIFWYTRKSMFSMLTIVQNKNVSKIKRKVSRKNTDGFFFFLLVGKLGDFVSVLFSSFSKF